uniref:zinc metalloproteinase nas-6-like isoform X2 n=1 Tax=Styela clava TaxID=7725 RepID=UPI001939F5A5|nr:zinc metalloproteinase nas-6-like isoform X2 [Styela clava]
MISDICVLLFVLCSSFTMCVGAYSCEEILNGFKTNATVWEVNACYRKQEEFKNGLIEPNISVFLKQAGRQCSTNILRDCPSTCIWYKRGSNGCATCKCDYRGNNGLFESDIRLRKTSIVQLMNMLRGGWSRAGSGTHNRWPLDRTSGHYIIPYVLTPYLGTAAKSAINEAIEEIESKTCIRLKKKNNEENYIEFKVGRGCWSDVGMHQGANQISIGRGCSNKGIVVHEIMHSIGFWHEHSRPDRDNYIKIVYENIDTDDLENFQKFSSSEVVSYGSKYDIGSVMHYSSTAFSKNGFPTLLDATGQELQTQSKGLSYSDIEQINKMYPCHSSSNYFSSYFRGKRETTCIDSRLDCKNIKLMCNLPTLRIALKKECRRTCGYC